jgi:hypothetical protein
MAEKEKNTAVINISKALAGLSFAALAAVGAASGSIMFAGLAAIPAVALANTDSIGSLLSRSRQKQDELLELPAPPWWRSDISSWRGLCAEIEQHLPNTISDMARQLQQQQGVVTSMVVRQAFIDAIAAKTSVWEFDPVERRKAAEYIATPVLQKISDVLKPIVGMLQQETSLLDLHNTSMSSAEQVTLARELVEAMKQAISVLEKIHEDVNKPSEGTITTTSKDAAPLPVNLPITLAQTNSASNVSNSDVAAILRAKINADTYDVFLCYNSKDGEAVKKIAFQLKEHGILPWSYKRDMIPGRSVQQTLSKQIRNMKAAAVFVGLSGMGPWHQIEMEALLRQFASRDCPVIPVLLATAPVDQDMELELPLFLGNIAWVDFREKTPDPLQQLIRGITQSS